MKQVDGTLPDGDVPVSCREWRAALRSESQRTSRWVYVAIGAPIGLFFIMATFIVHQFSEKLRGVLAQRVLEVAASHDLEVELNQVMIIANGILAKGFISMGLGAILFVFLAVLYAAVMTKILGQCARFFLRTKADLRLALALQDDEKMTTIPLIGTAAFVFMTWMVIRYVRLESVRVDPGATGLIEGSSALIVSLIVAIAVGVGVRLKAKRRDGVPAEFLHRHIQFAMPIWGVLCAFLATLEPLVRFIVRVALRLGEYASTARFESVVRDRLPLNLDPIIRDLLSQPAILRITDLSGYITPESEVWFLIERFLGWSQWAVLLALVTYWGVFAVLHCGRQRWIWCGLTLIGVWLCFAVSAFSGTNVRILGGSTGFTCAAAILGGITLTYLTRCPAGTPRMLLRSCSIGSLAEARMEFERRRLGRLSKCTSDDIVRGFRSYGIEVKG